MEDVWLSSGSQGESMVVTIRGDLDIVTSPALDDCLTQLQASHKKIILDVSAVDFLDTSALAVIVGHWKHAEADEGTLALAGARYKYTKTLWITGLADRLTLYDTVEQGVAAQAGQGPQPASAEPAAGRGAAEQADG
ncbi:MAG TPA: STAS domain-containing protein [Streptosporangiaceae bacterium]